MNKNQTLPIYFKQWIEMYKLGAVADVTYHKYVVTQKKLKELAPNLRLGSITRIKYQELLNKYACTHERQTVLDFHHQVKSALLDAVEEGIIKKDPTRRIVIKGTKTQRHKPKFLNEKELESLLQELDLNNSVNWDYLILLISKTGLRFAEALGLTPSDFNFQKQEISVSKTWDYKSPIGKFAPTKNTSSVRKVRIDWQLAMQFNQLLQGLPKNEPFFVQQKRVYNATVNDRLAKLCSDANIPIISIHGLRHTHASLLLYAGVSVASVAKRLGHSNMTTTQTTYLHVIRELENKDNDKVMQFLSTL
ncbi:site-specific integrase [Bifidobacterium sp. ESL0775]|uniref:site-specific integrase n=1 Tax=Bifidobacterium sp. ESL0775 TaxID=2983230 RepID=UPI0023F8A6E5|nr:site-specific integrase [Bifidobacterium sp. ESL0775]WEV68914.1 site-specific integrase [Bifidobacterium sp. ESL0775]